MKSPRYLKLFPAEPSQTRTFPAPIEPPSDDESVGWKLAHAPQHLTREDQLYAASVIQAYAYLVCEMTAKDRQAVVMEIRRLLDERDADLTLEGR